MKTVMASVPATPMSSNGICAWSLELLRNVVGRLWPFHCTVEVEIRLEPFTVKVNEGPPRTAVVGSMVVITGTGFGGGPVDPDPLPQPN